MSVTFFHLIAFFSAGIGLSVAAGLSGLLRRRAAWSRVLVALLACTGTAAAVYGLTEDLPAVGLSALVLACGLGACALVASDRFVAVCASVVSTARPPAARWSLLALAGVALAVSSIAIYDADQEFTADRDMADLVALTTPPPTKHPFDVRTTTDRGTPVIVKEATALRTEDDLHRLEAVILQTPTIAQNVIRRQSATDRANCHGWVFAGGKYWIGGAEIDQILQENYYREVADPQPGDLAIYRGDGAVLHTAIVRYVSPGQPVLVEGKWGCTGVFLHPAEQSIYGTEFTFYRSPRAGHLLLGLNASTGPEQTTPVDVTE